MTGDDALRREPDAGAVPPAAVVAFLDGEDLDGKVGIAVEVITTDADGWPHPAQLSPGEILLAPDGAVRLAMHPDGTTAGNLRRDGRVVLVLAADGASHELRFEVTEAGPLADPPLATFTGRMVVARAHRSPYADVVGGVQYTLHDRDGTVQRWRRQIAALRQLSS
ncbi:MAG TPA: hypothetical protein VH395_12990 [Jatrophihabitantaceae bacterium]|jgi:hypothetical protein